MKKILAIFLAAAMMLSLSVVGFAETTTETVSDLKGLTEAVAKSDITITLEADIEVTEPLYVRGSNVTIDGDNKYSISAASGFSKNGEDGSVITILGSGVILKNLAVAGNTSIKTEKYGVQVYGANASATLTNVTIENCGWGAMLVNGGSVEAEGLTLKNNAWGIEVDNGENIPENTEPSLTLADVDISGQGDAAIWIPEKTLALAQVDISGADSIVASVASEEEKKPGTRYYSLEDALTQDKGFTVVLEKDVVIDETISVGKNLNGNNNTIIAAEGFTGDTMLQITGDVDISNLAVNNNQQVGTSIQIGKNGDATFTGSLTLEGTGTGIAVTDISAKLNLASADLDTSKQGGYILSVPQDIAEENISLPEGMGEGQPDASGGTVYPSNGTPDDPVPTPTPTPVADDDDDNIAATDNDANTAEAKDAIRAGETVEVKLRSGTAGIALATMDLLGANKDASIVAAVGDMTVEIPGGFGRVNEPGRIYFPLDYRSPSRQESWMETAVPEDAEFETVEAGGAMTMPATVTVTLDTDLEGTVYVYLYDEDQNTLTFVASPVEEDGQITFATRTLGHFLLVSERI